METIEELKKQLQEIQEGIAIYREKNRYSGFIKAWFSEAETDIWAEIKYIETGRKCDTEITVFFPDKNLTIKENDSKNTYIKVVEEFGVNEIHQKFPRFFKKTSDGNSTVHVGANKYLEVGVRNKVKKEKIKMLSKGLPRVAWVYFSLA